MTRFVRICSRTFFIALLIFVSFLGSAHADEYVPDASIVYKKLGNYELKLHIFKPSKSIKSGNRPAIVYFHGGGWVRGSASEFYPQSRYLASKGIVAVSAEYRTKEKYGTSPRECVKDGKSAIRWMRSHAAELGVNPHKLAAGGASAGGHIALAAATTKYFEEPGEDVNVSSRPDALVLFSPILDTGPDHYGYGKVRDYWRDISPIHNLNKNVPPTIIFLGTNDKIVPVATAERFKKVLSYFSVPCELVLYAGQGHTFFEYSRNDKYFIETMAETERFLRALGYLDDEHH